MKSEIQSTTDQTKIVTVSHGNNSLASNMVPDHIDIITNLSSYLPKGGTLIIVGLQRRNTVHDCT